MNDATIENGFAKVGSGNWLVCAGQPTAVLGDCVPSSLRGWIVPDRSKLHLVKLEGEASCSCVERPFLTQVTCAAPMTVVSAKVLLAPAEARSGSRVLRVIPFSFRSAICVTEFAAQWLVLATRSRTTRIVLNEEQLLTVRLEAAVAWTTKSPTAFCPRISIWNIILPRKKDPSMLLHFYGPGIVWMEGSNAS